MTTTPRPFRKGDRVTLTATVKESTGAGVIVDLGGERTWLPAAALALIEPAEPPVGSVVVHNGQAWVRGVRGWWYGTSPATSTVKWSDLADGDVIFTPGGDAPHTEPQPLAETEDKA